MLQIHSTPPPNPVYPEPHQHKRLQTTCSSGQPKPTAPRTANPSTGSCFLNASATRSDSAPCLGTDHPVARKNRKEVAAEALAARRCSKPRAGRRTSSTGARRFRADAPEEDARKLRPSTSTASRTRARSAGLCLEARSRLHDLGITGRECADRRQDDPPASAGCAMTARSFWIWSARRARRRTASATCVTGPPGAVQPRARAASPIPSLFAISPMFTAAPTASSPASGARSRSAMIAPRLRGAGFRRSCEVLPGNVSEPGTLEDALSRLEAARRQSRR